MNINLFSRIILVFVLLSVNNCNPSGQRLLRQNAYIEAHRKLVLEEMLNRDEGRESLINIITMKKRSVPDSLLETAIGDYLIGHPELPGYIQNALIKKTPMLMMTMQEFLLLYENDVTKFLARISPYNEIDVADRWVTQDSKIYFEGNYWIFKYGFLWDWGVS